MSFAGPRHLLSHREDDFTIFSIKNLGVSFAKQENILKKLSLISTFEELSKWVVINSGAKRFIANPSSIANNEDRNSCLGELQALILLAIKGQGDRKNGRDVKLKRAAGISDYATIARVLASASGTYWRDHGFFSKDKQSRQKRAIVSQIQNSEKNQQKKDFQKAQIDHIGAAVEFTKARKKGAFQQCLDFVETEEILEINDFED